MATIGNTQVGNNDRFTSNQVWKGIRIPGFAGGNITSGSARLQGGDDPVLGTWQMAVLSSAGSVLATSATRNDITSAALANYTFTFSSQLIAAQEIILAVAVDGQTNVGIAYFEDTGTYEGLTSDSTYALNASTVGFLDDTGRDYSLVLTYNELSSTNIRAIAQFYNRLRQG